MNYSKKLTLDLILEVKAASLYNSFPALVRFLEKSGYNSYETEAILRSDLPQKAIDEFGYGAGHGKGNTGTLKAYLNLIDAKPRSPIISKLVMKYFKDSDGLELNEDGVPCRRGTVPGNPKAGTILVPIGTPLCCDPTSETYWSM